MEPDSVHPAGQVLRTTGSTRPRERLLPARHFHPQEPPSVEVIRANWTPCSRT